MMAIAEMLGAVYIYIYISGVVKGIDDIKHRKKVVKISMCSFDAWIFLQLFLFYSLSRQQNNWIEI